MGHPAARHIDCVVPELFVADGQPAAEYEPHIEVAAVVRFRYEAETPRQRGESPRPGLLDRQDVVAR